MKKIIRIYLATPIRGEKGDKATFEDMQFNCDKARKCLNWLEENFPWVEFFCPAVNDRIVQRMMLKKYVTAQQILECDHEEQKLCSGILALSWCNSPGVDIEIALAAKIAQPIYIIQDLQKMEINENKLFDFFYKLRKDELHNI
jgi:hypothetical protein